MFSCTPAKKMINQEYDDLQTNKDEIVFLVLKIRKDSVLNMNVIEVVDKIKVEGKVKNNDEENGIYENYLAIQVYEKGTLIQTMKIAHPLFKSVEYAEENILTSKTILLDEQEFFFRLRAKSGLTQVKIHETIKNDLSKELITIQL
jgi:hypothetical protein